MGKELRLDKYLADMGKGTRSEARNLIRKGRVSVNGLAEKKPERKVNPSEDQVTLDGCPVAYVDLEYYMLNKPVGVVSATEDKKYPTVVELIGERNRKDLFPVGRLDLDTEGLLLITNDGELAHRLLSPKHHVDKVYLAECAGAVPETAVSAFSEGLLLPDGLQCLPAKLEILEIRENSPEISIETDGVDLRGEDFFETRSLVRLTIREGKFHQVKRMMEAAGCPVLSLKRLSMGPITLDKALKPGESRPLTDGELELLKAL